MKNRVFAILACTLVWAFNAVALADTAERDGQLLADALISAAQNDWEQVDTLRQSMTDPVARDVVEWQRLRSGQGGWDNYQSFIERNGDWPGLKLLRRKGEASIPHRGSPTQIRSFFEIELPQTGKGALRLAEAYAAQGNMDAAHREIVRAWLDLSLNDEEQEAFLARYPSVLKSKHLDRLENLLWKGWTNEATDMLPLVGADMQKLAKARIGLRRVDKNVDTLIAAVPARLQNDAGLTFERFLWRIAKGRWDDAQQMILEQSKDPKQLGRAEEWTPRRRGFARRAMRSGDHAAAYVLASNHGVFTGDDYADLEWLSGYLALRYLNSPQKALQHFNNFQTAVASPISLGRAGYWKGRAFEAMGNYDAAMVAYELGAQHQTSYYGQLAAEKLGGATDDTLSGKETVPDWRDAAFVNSSAFQAGLIFHYADNQNRLRQFFMHMAETMDATEAAQLADLALEMDRPFVAIGIAKEVAKRGIVLPRPYFPVTDLASFTSKVDGEVAMSIARRESELDPYAQSHAGARGLMQVMPGTAKLVAGEIGVDYSTQKLGQDWKYNATLGTHYLAGLLDKYNGSYVLAFAGYNAGPHRADAWIKEYGDPRKEDVDVVDWVEHIPYTETRNYVMRVIESLHVYRARLTGSATPVALSVDLAKG
ncbi:lytic transglycosylase [Amylibacter ulvae]|uniref:Lytic transglycosylase n=1 Tax=Paramylibacter ulvae TaxID=1651968 RepID=A0ABQ3D7L7_9RHOB|nr:lytic transglycosylase domain-containing protein [Amylibacter ulvae]GHA59643.1 lytic transglycosylase [Amylibacter ulvae]